MKTVLILFALLILVIVAGKFTLDYLQKNPNIFAKTQKVTIGGQSFNLLIAQSEKDKQVGLSGRDSITKDSGMIFPFDKAGDYPFWMRNMKFPLDILYINGTKIVMVFKNVQPPQQTDGNPQIVRSDEPADKVIELTAGTVDKYNIKKGDEIKL